MNMGGRSTPGGKKKRKTERTAIQIGQGGIMSGWVIPGDQHEVPDIHDGARGLTQNKDGVLDVHGVGEEQEATSKAEIPEGRGNDAHTALLRNHPLDKESTEKKQLGDQS
jgi:hypothetical protein